MATTSPLGGFADLSAYSPDAIARRAQRPGILDAILGGIQQGVELQQLPQTIERNALNNQLAQLIQQEKLRELQQGKVLQAGRSVIRINPQTGQPEVIFTAPTDGNTPESFQTVGITKTGEPLLFGPRSRTFELGKLPEGVDISGGLLPKTVAPETFSLAGFQGDTPVQFGSRGSGITPAPIQPGLDIKGPLQPKTQASMRKGVLVQDEKGNVKYDVLSEGEEVEKGSKIFTQPSSNDEAGLRKEFLSNEVVKDFIDIAPQYQRIQQALEEAKTTSNFTAVDQTLVNTFNRILDPKSVVRESEYARTSQDQSVLDYLKGRFDPKTGRIFVGGAGLTPETREAMARMAKRFFDASQTNYSQTAAFYSNLTREKGLSPSNVIPPIGGFQFNDIVPRGTDTPVSTGLPKLIKITPRAAP